MTTPTPSENPAEYLVGKTAELSQKTLGVTQSVAETVGKRVRALDALRTNEGVTADPARMKVIVDGLFEAADALILLAEDVRGAMLRAERTRQDEAKPKSKRAVETDELSRDEQELYDELISMEGEPVSVEYLLDNGFAISITTDRTVRKRVLQKCLDSLAQKLARTGAEVQLAKEGRTRGTKYSLISSIQLPGDASAVEAPQALDTTEDAPEPTEVAAEPQAQVVVEIAKPEPRREDPFELLVAHTIDTAIRLNEKRPYLCVQDIVRIGFHGRHLEQEDFQRLRALADSDHRLEKVAHGEYRIIGRDLEQDWIDRGALRESAKTFVDNMVRWGSSEETLVNLFKAAGRTGMWLTNPERTELVTILKNDYRVVSVTAGNFTVNPTRTEKDDPDRHLKGMSPSELDRALGKLGMKGSPGFRRKR